MLPPPIPPRRGGAGVALAYDQARIISKLRDFCAETNERANARGAALLTSLSFRVGKHRLRFAKSSKDSSPPPSFSPTELSKVDGWGSIEKSLCRSKYCGCKANLRLGTEETECPPPPSGRDTFKSFRCL